MKVLWFSLSPCGSVRRNLTQRSIQGWMISLEDEIKKHNHIQLSVAYYSDEDKEPFEYDGVTYYPMYTDVSSKTGLVVNRYRSIESKDKECLPKLIDVVERCSPDLIHIHGTEENFCNIAEYINDVPICVSIQGMLAPYYEKFFSGFSESEFNSYQSLFTKLKGVSASKQHKDLSVKARREIAFLKKVKYVFGRTSWDYRICKLFNPEINYFTVNEILRPEFFHRSWDKTKFSQTIKLVTIVSSGQIIKGLDTLFKTAQLLKEHAKFDYEWNIIGCEKDDWQIDMAEKITGYKMQDVHIVNGGKKNADELATILSQADIYCHTSHIENSSNSICEAMLVGTPIVATFAGGTVDIVKDCASLIQDGDPYAMAGTIIQVISNFDEAKAKSLKGRDIALKRHTPHKVAEELLKAYNSIWFFRNLYEHDPGRV